MSTFLRQVLKLLLEFRAKLLRQRFVCNALQGESEYNISINCDMTVSCNCQDDGSGILGSLDNDTFEEIFFGPTANRFRETLAKGKFPILTCVRCGELKRAPAAVDNCSMLVDKGTPTTKQTGNPATPCLPHRGIMAENTVACDLSCLGCIRPEVAKIRRKTQMSLDDVRKVSALIQRLGIEKLFYFNRGEPFLSQNILEEMRIIREMNPNVRIITSTNGLSLNSALKRDAALLMDEVIFSIDGSDQSSLQKYQRGGDFERALSNLRQLVRFREARGLEKPQIEWKYVLFNWNDRSSQIMKATALAKDAGVDLISFWPTNTPVCGISLRYRLGWLNNVGEKSWKGRELRLRPVVNCDT